jgi:hypothetical protein
MKIIWFVFIFVLLGSIYPAESRAPADDTMSIASSVADTIDEFMQEEREFDLEQQQRREEEGSSTDESVMSGLTYAPSIGGKRSSDQGSESSRSSSGSVASTSTCQRQLNIQKDFNKHGKDGVNVKLTTNYYLMNETPDPVPTD